LAPVSNAATRQPTNKNRQPIISKQKQKNSDKMKELMLANSQKKNQEQASTNNQSAAAKTV